MPFKHYHDIAIRQLLHAAGPFRSLAEAQTAYPALSACVKQLLLRCRTSLWLWRALAFRQNANSFYRTVNGTRHELFIHAPRASAQRQQHLFRVIRAQTNPTNLSGLPNILPETQKTLNEQVGD